MYREEDFLEAINQSLQIYNEKGSESSEKQKPLYDYIGSVIKEIWGEDYTIQLDKKIVGQHYNKKVNILIKNNRNEPIFCLNINSYHTGVKKNLINNFERMLGLITNIQNYQNTPVAQILIIRNQAISEEKKSNKIRLDEIKDKDLQPFLSLVCGINNAHCPYATAIFLVQENEDNKLLEVLKPNNLYNEDFAYFLNNYLSMENLLKKIKDYKRYCSLPTFQQ